MVILMSKSPLKFVSVIFLKGKVLLLIAGDSESLIGTGIAISVAFLLLWLFVQLEDYWGAFKSRNLSFSISFSQSSAEVMGAAAYYPLLRSLYG
jgi:hypothetical protein